jgi:hypothetical protein
VNRGSMSSRRAPRPVGPHVTFAAHGSAGGLDEPEPRSRGQGAGGRTPRGGLVAGGLFVLPGVIALLALSAIYVASGATTVVTAVFVGLAAAALAIVAQAVVRVAKRALDSRASVVIAVAAFLALSLFGVPFPSSSRSPDSPAGRSAAGDRPRCRRRRRPRPGRRSVSGDLGRRAPPRGPSTRRTLKVLLVGLLVRGCRWQPLRSSPGRAASSPSRGCSPARRW